jgi:myo-inositol-1-phosphate synthase
MYTTYHYQTTQVATTGDLAVLTPISRIFQFKTLLKVPKVGVMIVGLGGNNGTILTAGVFANRRHLTWDTKFVPQSANYYGSLTQCATTYLGDDLSGRPVVAAFKDLLPMVNPNELVISGWDISGANLYEAAKLARVLEPGLIEELRDELSAITPLLSAFDAIGCHYGRSGRERLAGTAKFLHIDRQLRQPPLYRRSIAGPGTLSTPTRPVGGSSRR